VAALLAVPLAYLWFAKSGEQPPGDGQDPSARDSADTSAEAPAPPSKHPLARVPGRPRHPRTPTSSEARRDCEPYVTTGCYAGNVHWFDSCGNVLDTDRACGEGFCKDGDCVDLDWASTCKEPPQGRCEGDVLELCHAGEELSIDCQARGQVCRRGLEGFGCYGLSPGD
jgi:hypothetical protein